MMEGLDAKTVQQLAQWTAVLEKNPKDFNALNQRGSLSLYAAHRSRYSVFRIYRAAKDLESAIKLNPTDFYARHNYAQAAFEAGDWGDAQPNMHLAVIQFTKAIELNPKSARSYMGRGWAYLMLNDQSHAEADFKKTRELDPSLQADLEKEASGCRAGNPQADRSILRGACCPHRKRMRKIPWTVDRFRMSDLDRPEPHTVTPRSGRLLELFRTCCTNTRIQRRRSCITRLCSTTAHS
jgi:tetratricopeptide (TPR) repeat protein